MAARVPVYLIITEEGTTLSTGVPLSALIDTLAMDEKYGRYSGAWTIVYPSSGKPAALHNPGVI